MKHIRNEAMNKQEQIDQLVDIMQEAVNGREDCDYGEVASEIVNHGYGNIKKFAEELKDQCRINSDLVGGCGGYCVSPCEIEGLLKRYMR